MKGRLIANGVMSILSSILFIVAIVSLVKIADVAINNRGFNSDVRSSAISALTAYVMLFFGWIANLVLGIVTLAMEKNESVRGLTIASGILAIFNGVFFVNAIISFIAVAKIGKA